MKKRIRVLLADDHKIVLDGLKSLLEPERPGPGLCRGRAAS